MSFDLGFWQGFFKAHFVSMPAMLTDRLSVDVMGERIGPDTSVHKNFHTPDWVKEAVFYQIFPDRFAQSTRVRKPNGLEPWDAIPSLEGYKGGDLLGVVERLDHLERLGVNAVYFNPVFQSGSNHRFHTHDYHLVDPMLGGNQALYELIEAAHARGIKIVLDGVFNHASRGFFQFHDVLENGLASAYADWFHIQDWPLDAYGTGPANYHAWWGIKALPKFNTSNPAVREYLWDVAERWIKAGIDGWRLDVPNEIDDDGFWQEFRRRVKALNPEAYIVGEIWEEAGRWLQGDQFDAVMNYPFTRLAHGFTVGHKLDQLLVEPSGYKYIEPVDAPTLASRLERLLKLYPWEATLAQLNLLGSHDTPRLHNVANGDSSTIMLGTLLQMTLPGTPCIYYGDEIGLEGRHDPDCRRGMPWNEHEWNHDLLKFMQSAVRLRRDTPALQYGSYRTLYARGMTYAFERHLKSGSVIVAFNADTQEHRITLEGIQDGTYIDWATQETLEVHDGVRVLGHVAARSGMVLIRQ
jgi:cyclomaltodextrinase / maltogenic alpha-amylase / neopullulanase